MDFGEGKVKGKLRNEEAKKRRKGRTEGDRQECRLSCVKKFRPLLDAPAPGQSKFDQILEWAKKQQKSKRGSGTLFLWEEKGNRLKYVTI
jgi:hypothetical protein